MKKMSSSENSSFGLCSPKSAEYWRTPRFDRHQTVRFFGGTGKIKSIHKQDIGWTYHVEMSLGVEPDFGRVGTETTVVLEEQDILAIESVQLQACG